MPTKDHFDEIVALLLRLMDDSDERKAIVETSLFGCPVLRQIQWDLASMSSRWEIDEYFKDRSGINEGALRKVAL